MRGCAVGRAGLPARLGTEGVGMGEGWVGRGKVGWG